MEGGLENKQNYFILTAVQNFHNWIQSVLDSIQQTQIDFASQSMSLTETFIDHEIDSSVCYPQVPVGLISDLPIPRRKAGCLG